MLEVFHSRFFPFQLFFTGPEGQRLRHLLIRRNYDLFRVSIDFMVLALIYPLFLKDAISVWWYTVMLSLYFGLSLIYQVYYHVFHKIYQLEPVFFHDFLMLKTAGQIFIHEFGRRNFLMILVAGLIGLSGGMLIYYMIDISRFVSFGFWSYLVMSLFACGALYTLIHYPYSKYPQLTFQSQLQSFIRNISISGKSRRSIEGLTLKYMKEFNVDPAIQLRIRPNIYFVVIESYGRIAHEETALREHFMRYAPGLETTLAASGWNMSSGYTTSPVTGGASWISYTSMLYGLNVRNQGVYLAMLKNKYMAEYDSLFHWLKRQGYKTARISSLGGYEKMEIPYDSYSRLYGIDDWVKYKDLAYTGEHYGFGPSPPDQYALWMGNQITYEIAGNAPRAVFFITQNSHTPYDSPGVIAEDWQSLNNNRNTTKKPSAFWSRPRFEKYGEVIEYQLRYLSDFIVKNGTDNDIFILIGDHQPPSMSMAMDNFDTPMHVISRDMAFIKCWDEYGLTQGLFPGEKNALRQEAIHWALLRSLIKTYAQEDAKFPPFLPNGIPY
jgi:hypothetical protein